MSCDHRDECYECDGLTQCEFSGLCTDCCDCEDCDG